MTARSIFRILALSTACLMTGCATSSLTPTVSQGGQNQSSQAAIAKPAACACKARQQEQ